MIQKVDAETQEPTIQEEVVEPQELVAYEEVTVILDPDGQEEAVETLAQ